LKIISLLILLITMNFSLYGQANWTVEKDKDGIKISTRPAASSQFNDIRVETDLPGNIEQLKTILLDVNRYKEWSYATKKSSLIKTLGPGRLIYYSEFEVPWPATNRYFYADIDLKEDSNAHTLNVIAVNLPNYLPAYKDLVEVVFTKGIWKVTTLSGKAIHVDYTLQLNPGGSLPSWVINLFSSKGPMETFENIKQKMISLNRGTIN
jgi:START domain